MMKASALSTGIPDPFEDVLRAALGHSVGEAKGVFSEAMFYAVFPGGARLRPKLCLLVAESLNESCTQTAMWGAAAVELLHCASLVHDDMPCFDDAAIRRGRPTVQRKYGEATALLVGDGLIFSAFEAVASGFEMNRRAIEAVRWLSSAGGVRSGLTGGQAYELDRIPEESGPLDVDKIQKYHDQKTGALFELACALGAISAGYEGSMFAKTGALLGRLYQTMDDLADRTVSSAELGKPAGQDDRHERPNIVSACAGLETSGRIEALVDEIVDSVPHWSGRPAFVRRLRTVIDSASKNLGMSR